MKKIIATAMFIATAASPVMAQSVGQWYGEASYNKLSITSNDTDNAGAHAGKYSNQSIGLGVGNVVMDNLAIEGFVYLPSTNASNTYSDGSTITLKTKSAYGISIRPFLKVTNELEVFGRLGRAWVKNGGSFDDGQGGVEDFSDKSHNNFLGAGFAYKINNQYSVVADYKKLLKVEDGKGSVLAVGVRYNF